MAGVDPVSPRAPFSSTANSRNKLILRVLSSLVMAPLAVAAAYAGDYIFLAFWAIAALGVLWEWDGLVCTHDKNPVFIVGSVTVIGIAMLWILSRPIPALMLIGLGMLGVAALATKIRRAWCVAGLAYAAAIFVAPLVLRRDPTEGFWAVIFVFGVVWSSDIGAYIAGRGLGGPKLAPRISPNKTWTGAIGGLLAGVSAGVVVAIMASLDTLVAVGIVAFVLSVFSQAGDLLESAIKRKFNAKDASGLIPGHGGLMDRLDGFVVAAGAAAIIGITRGGFDAPGRGLLIW